MLRDRFKELLYRYLDGSLTAAEHDDFFAMASTELYNDLLSDDIQHFLKEGVLEESSSIPPHVAQEIVRNIFKAEVNTSSVLPLQKRRKNNFYWLAAASIVAIVGIMGVYFLGNRINPIENVSTAIPEHTIIIRNTDSEKRLVELNDGSKVFLEPNSSIQYKKNFNTTNREIYLDGDAFFEVARNPAKPFYVYYHDVVAKVLGTSFRVNTNKTTGKIEVAVKTGKVQVYENAKTTTTGKHVASAIIVAPNQKAVYDMVQHQFQSALVEKPMQVVAVDTISQRKTDYSLKFEQKNLSDVLNLLQSFYGVEIVVENSNVYNCMFTGDVSDQDLFSVLNTICLATNSTYEINQTIVLIKGKGCTN
jgi:ferric-dicitrate binding protein FerR (iron transport regulator)